MYNQLILVLTYTLLEDMSRIIFNYFGLNLNLTMPNSYLRPTDTFISNQRILCILGKFLCDIKENREEITLLTHQTASWVIKTSTTSNILLQIISHIFHISHSSHHINFHINFMSSQALLGYTFCRNNLDKTIN